VATVNKIPSLRDFLRLQQFEMHPPNGMTEKFSIILCNFAAQKNE
jgi:hypothetical protein